ncbi:hypothetical protein D3C72_1012520 [compost metagenome]
MNKGLRKRLIKVGVRPYRRIYQIHVSDVLTVMESFFGEKLASMTDQEIKEAAEYVIEKLRLSWSGQIKAAFDDYFNVKASSIEGKLWNVPDAEYEILSDAWKAGAISDADFTEKLHELEEKYVKKLKYR